MEQAKGTKGRGGCSKGQYFSFDAVVATVIFIIAIAMLSTYWFGIYSVIDAQDDTMYREALRISDSFMTPGLANNWDTLPDLWDVINDKSNVQQVGFATGYEGNNLSSSKLKKFAAYVTNVTPGAVGVNYDRSKSMLRTANEYYLTVAYYDQAKDNETIFYVFGKDPAAYGASNTVRVDRIGALNVTADPKDIKPVMMHLILWTSKRST